MTTVTIIKDNLHWAGLLMSLVGGIVGVLTWTPPLNVYTVICFVAFGVGLFLISKSPYY